MINSISTNWNHFHFYLAWGHRVENCTEQTLTDIIERHVASGSIVHTNGWAGYSGVNRRLGMIHHTVNHSLHFKNPETGIHTNTIEGMWNEVKLQVPNRNRTRDKIDEHLIEILWRRKNKRDLWSVFIIRHWKKSTIWINQTESYSSIYF